MLLEVTWLQSGDFPRVNKKTWRIWGKSMTQTHPESVLYPVQNKAQNTAWMFYWINCNTVTRLASNDRAVQLTITIVPIPRGMPITFVWTSKRPSGGTDSIIPSSVSNIHCICGVRKNLSEWDKNDVHFTQPIILAKTRTILVPTSVCSIMQLW